MRRIRWTSIALLTANLLLLAVNGWQLDSLRRTRDRFDHQLQAMREAQETRPPHPCGSVIMPGESCYETMVIIVPGEKTATY